MQKEKVSLIVHSSAIVTMDAERSLIYDGAVAVKNNRIVAIGKTEDILLGYSADDTIDGSDKALMPGLIDLHAHSTLTRGICDDDELLRYLQVVYPKTAALTPEDAYIGALTTHCDSIKSGTTCINDMYRHMLSNADAVEKSGIRANLSCILGDDSFGIETVEANKTLVRERHESANGRIRTCFGIEGTLMVSAENLAEIRDFCQQYDIGLHTHIGETEECREGSRKRHGKVCLEVLNDYGLLGPKTILAHCVKLNDEETSLIVNSGAHISHNPHPNAKCGMGVAPIPKLRDLGVNIGLGHDTSTASNSQDLFEVMRFAVLIQRAYTGNPCILTAMDALEMATINGARALGLGDEIGSIEVGKKADMILIDLDTPHMTPRLTGKFDNLMSNLVYSAQGSDVNTSIIDGRIVMRNREILTFDEKEALFRANIAGNNLMARIDA